MPHALLVDDDAGFVLGLAEAVKREGFDGDHGLQPQGGPRGTCARREPDALLVDMQLPDGSGLELLQAPEGRIPPGVIFISGHASVEMAVEALRLGATDFLTKPVDFARVKMALANLTRTRELSEQVGALRGELRRLGRFGAMIGGSRRMQEVYDLIAKVAPTDASVFVLGRDRHGQGARGPDPPRDEPPAEAALRAHQLRRGRRPPSSRASCSATSAAASRAPTAATAGHFERAHEGTLFLDEITRDAGRPPGQAAARAGDADGAARGRQRAGAGERAR